VDRKKEEEKKNQNQKIPNQNQKKKNIQHINNNPIKAFFHNQTQKKTTTKK